MKFSDLVKNAESFPIVKKVPMFRAGNYGNKGVYAESDLDEMAASYDPNYLQAPITPDHVETGPAWGWIINVYREGDTLFGDWQMHPDSYQLLKDGKYKRRSIEFWTKHEMPDGRVVPYVKACSVLGAATPHCKGMPDIQFTEAAEPSIDFDFEPATPGEEVTFCETKTMKEATSMKDEATKLAEAQAEAKKLADEKAELERQLSAVTGENQKLADEVASTQKQMDEQGKLIQNILSDTRAKDAAFKFNEVIRENRDKVSPAQEAYLREIYSALTKVDDKVSFTAPGSKDAVETSPAELVLDLIRNSAKIVPVGGAPTSDNRKVYNQPTDEVDMSDPGQGKAFNDRLVSRIDELMNEDKNLTYTDAAIKADRELRATA